MPPVTGEGDARPILELRDVVKTYPGVLAVDHVSLSFGTGEIVGLVGKNGAGKSTIIKMLAGIVHPDSGEILLDGEEFTLATPHDATLRGMMFVHQELAVIPELSVAENVFMGLGFPRRLGQLVDFDALRARAAEVLAQLADHIDPAAPIDTLPIADQRVCMIARALAASARVIVMDEPTASLTATEVDQLMTVLRQLRDRGLTIIYVSHRLDEILAVTDRTVVMRDGAVVADAITASFDTRSLIEEITGDSAASTALERRSLRGVGGTPDTGVAMAVESVTVPDRVNDVSFELRQGEILGIAGLVGAGRTELVRAIFGVETGSSGHVAVHGAETQIKKPGDALQAGIVLFPEDRRHQGLVLDFSVSHNLTLGMLRRERMHRWLPFPSARRERDTSLGLVEALSIKTPSETVPAKLLSGGNQQKVVIGRWLESDAEIFMFDEPTHGIDVGAKEEIYQLIEGLASAGRSIILISSEFSELVGVCNRVLVIREGDLVGELVGDEITERAILEKCYGRPVA